MRWKTVIIGLAVAHAVASVGMLSAQAQSGQKTKRQWIEHVDYFIPPEGTIAESLKTADVVVRGRVLSSTGKGIPRSAEARMTDPQGREIPEAPRVFTELEIQIVEILKASAHFDGKGPLRILQRAGELDWNDVKIVVDAGDFKVLKPGIDYILMARWNPELVALTVRPDDVYSLTDGVVHSPGRGKASREQIGLDAGQFVSNLKKHLK